MLKIVGLVGVLALALAAFAQQQPGTAGQQMQDDMLRDLCEVYLRVDRLVMDVERELEAQLLQQPMAIPEADDPAVEEDVDMEDPAVEEDPAMEEEVEPEDPTVEEEEAEVEDPAVETDETTEVGMPEEAPADGRCAQFRGEFDFLQAEEAPETETDTEVDPETETDTEVDPETEAAPDDVGVTGAPRLVGMDARALEELRTIQDRLGQIIDQLEGQEADVTDTETMTDETDADVTDPEEEEDEDTQGN